MGLQVKSVDVGVIGVNVDRSHPFQISVVELHMSHDKDSHYFYIICCTLHFTLVIDHKSIPAINPRGLSRIGHLQLLYMHVWVFLDDYIAIQVHHYTQV